MNEALVISSRGDDSLALVLKTLAFECLDSTNDEARRRAECGAESGTVVWARRQSAGRGRRGRSWVSLEGNVYCSVLLRPCCPLAAAAQLSLVAAVAVARAVGDVLPSGRRVQLKWPNDVLIDGRKVSGVLLESGTDSSGGVDWVSVGVGINVCHFPEGTDYPATSLVAEGATAWGVEAVLKSFLDHFVQWYRIWQAFGPARVRAAWLESAVGVGALISVRLHREALTGKFVGLSEEGALLLAPSEGGPIRLVSAGDVFFPGMVGAPTVVPVF